MNRGEALLQQLLLGLRPWQSFMQRATGSLVAFTPSGSGEFSVTLRWRNKDGTDGEYTRKFTRLFCFGKTLELSPQAWAHQMKPCEHARALVKEVLRVRGVL